MTLKLKQIRRDGGTQVREALCTDHISALVEAFRARRDVPPVVVYHDGSHYWCADGFHRLEAAAQAGLKQVVVQVRRGDRRAALLYACGANAAHGLPRTNADKRRAVELLLRDAEWAQWSDRKLAEVAAVSHHLVQTIRHQLESDSSSTDPAASPEPPARTGRDGKKRRAKKAGAAPTTSAPTRETEPARVVGAWMVRHSKLRELIWSSASTEDATTLVLFVQMLRDVTAQIEEELLGGIRCDA